MIHIFFRDSIKQKPTSSPLSSSKVVPISSSSQGLLCPKEKNKAKNGFKSSAFEFNKRRADFFGETDRSCVLSRVCSETAGGQEWRFFSASIAQAWLRLLTSYFPASIAQAMAKKLLFLHLLLLLSQ
ncbi:hypothetical protein Bca52824_035258 [Brassica carinata]|uniref:Uncharacterized protein n=1 Tax=Brassica carinata TaxID=52824 RepID=A0A8X7V2J5_BRACI|nr:hypothetical protein Bca52824_035258 [Brassica carinata]